MPISPSPNSLIDTKLLRAVFGCARECNVSNDELHEAIRNWKKTSLKQLTRREAYTLMDGLREVAGVPNGRRRYAQGTHGKRFIDTAEGVQYRPSPSEWQILTDAATLRGWSRETLDGFIQRQLHRSIRTLHDYNKILWGLKAMNRRDKLHD